MDPLRESKRRVQTLSGVVHHGKAGPVWVISTPQTQLVKYQTSFTGINFSLSPVCTSIQSLTNRQTSNHPAHTLQPPATEFSNKTTQSTVTY